MVVAPRRGVHLYVSLLILHVYSRGSSRLVVAWWSMYTSACFRVRGSCPLDMTSTAHFICDATAQSEACHRNDTKLLIKSNSSTVLYAHRRHRVSDQCKHHKISMWAFQHSIRSNGASRALHIPHWSPKHWITGLERSKTSYRLHHRTEFSH